MDYQVWTHDDYEGWKKVDCGDKEAAMKEIDQAVRAGRDPLLTVAIPYKLNIKLEEDKIGETPKGKARPDKGAGAPGKGEVRPGDTGPVQELDQGSRDNGTGDSVPGK